MKSTRKIKVLISLVALCTMLMSVATQVSAREISAAQIGGLGICTNADMHNPDYNNGTIEKWGLSLIDRGFKVYDIKSIEDRGIHIKDIEDFTTTKQGIYAVPTLYDPDIIYIISKMSVNDYVNKYLDGTSPNTFNELIKIRNIYSSNGFLEYQISYDPFSEVVHITHYNDCASIEVN